MSYNRAFKDEHELRGMVKLYRKGYTLKSLAFIYDVDFTSIYHHVKGIKTNKRITLTLPNILSVFQVDLTSILNLLDIHPKQLKTYEEYLRESRMRNRFPNSYDIFRKV